MHPKRNPSVLLHSLILCVESSNCLTLDTFSVPQLCKSQHSCNRPHNGEAYEAGTIVTDHKFVRWMHSEAKQAKTLKFGAEKCLLQGQARRTGGSCSKDPNSLIVFREEFLKATFGVRGVGCVTFF